MLPTISRQRKNRTILSHLWLSCFFFFQSRLRLPRHALKKFGLLCTKLKTLCLYDAAGRTMRPFMAISLSLSLSISVSLSLSLYLSLSLSISLSLLSSCFVPLVRHGPNYQQSLSLKAPRLVIDRSRERSCGLGWRGTFATENHGDVRLRQLQDIIKSPRIEFER